MFCSEHLVDLEVCVCTCAEEFKLLAWPRFLPFPELPLEALPDELRLRLLLAVGLGVSAK